MNPQRHHALVGRLRVVVAAELVLITADPVLLTIPASPAQAAFGYIDTGLLLATLIGLGWIALAFC